MIAFMAETAKTGSTAAQGQTLSGEEDQTERMSINMMATQSFGQMQGTSEAVQH